MIILHSISLLSLVAFLVYIICFLCRYRVIPQSLSVTAEWSGRYRWWQVTICSVMGWLSYYFPTIYTFQEFSFWPILSSAGLGGLSLAGYYSYFPGEESKRELVIHKVGSFTGAILICLFYLLGLGKLWILPVLGVCLVLGLVIKGSRLGYSQSNSIIFWEEIGIIGIMGSDIVFKFIESI